MKRLHLIVLTAIICSLARPCTAQQSIDLRGIWSFQLDNEKAADVFRVDIGQNNRLIQWVAVRPDTLINEDIISEYEIYASPTRSALFNPGKTSRINVGHFMAKIIVDYDLWHKWKGQMPVIYNKISVSSH